MKLNGNDYNFGRVIYLTIFQYLSDSTLESHKFKPSELEKNGYVTICFDPTRPGAQKGQLNTRIDFYVKHLGESGVGNNGAFAQANIDIYNMGPALSQFFNAYNAYQSENRFKDVNTKKYAVVLQVGYRGMYDEKGEAVRHTVFTGRISSFVTERQQSNTTVDNVLHLFCQYPTSDGELGNDNKGVNGTNYGIEYGDTYKAVATYTSWEDYLKHAICSRRREVFKEVAVDESIHDYSFNTNVDLLDPLTPKQTPVVVKPEQVVVNLLDFNKYYRIEYKVSRTGKTLEKTKQYWQQQVPVHSWSIYSSNVQKLATAIAHATGCHARVEIEGSIQVIYIYPADWMSEIKYGSLKTNYTITDYQNLRKPPQVAANMLHLDMMMEPDMRPGDIIELKISDGFLKEHPQPTFEVAYSMANATTVFAGSNFVGLAQMNEESRQKNAIASAGNIFNTQFIATVVEITGSSHSPEWSTKVDCYGVLVNGKETSI